MNNNELSTEQIILEAAEAEFLEKGYSNTKTVVIAKRTGVSHSMLHYYFHTKEQLDDEIAKGAVCPVTIRDLNAQIIYFERIEGIIFFKLKSTILSNSNVK